MGLSGGELDSFLGSKVEAAVYALRLTERAVSAAPAPRPTAESRLLDLRRKGWIFFMQFSCTA